jgi:hypothetical protein
MPRFTPTVLASAVALAAIGATAAAETAPIPAPLPPAAAVEPTWNVGAKAGMLMPGEVYVDAGSFEGEVETDAGFAAMLGADAMVAPRLSIGGFGFAASFDDATILTFGGTIKGRFRPSGTMQVRPGLAVGYQTIDYDGSDSTTGFDLGGFVEVALPRAGSRTEWLFEAGFITQPSGGNEEIELTFGPIFYLSAGVGFAG